MMSLPNQQGVKTVSVMGKPGSSAAQILNSGSGQILALPGSTQTMIIGRHISVLDTQQWQRADTGPPRQHEDHDHR